MSSISLSTRYVDDFLQGKVKNTPQISLSDAHKSLQEKTCKGAEYLGWIDLPEYMSDEKISGIHNYSDTLRNESDVLIVCGIG